MRILIQINRSDLIDDVAIEFCKFYILLDRDVCVGAVNEFKVEFVFEILFLRFSIHFLIRTP
jgi:hypothetical protein